MKDLILAPNKAIIDVGDMFWLIEGEGCLFNVHKYVCSNATVPGGLYDYSERKHKGQRQATISPEAHAQVRRAVRLSKCPVERGAHPSQNQEAGECVVKARQKGCLIPGEKQLSLKHMSWVTDVLPRCVQQNQSQHPS